MEANNSINRSDIQRQLYKALVDAYEADKILLDTYGDTVTIKRPRDGADDDQEPSAGTDRGSKRRRSGKEPESTSAPREKTTMTAGKTTTGSTDVFEAPAHQEFETGVHDEQAEEEVHHLPDWFQQPNDYLLLNMGSGRQVFTGARDRRGMPSSRLLMRSRAKKLPTLNTMNVEVYRYKVHEHEKEKGVTWDHAPKARPLYGSDVTCDANRAGPTRNRVVTGDRSVLMIVTSHGECIIACDDLGKLSTRVMAVGDSSSLSRCLAGSAAAYVAYCRERLLLLIEVVGTVIGRRWRLRGGASKGDKKGHTRTLNVVRLCMGEASTIMITVQWGARTERLFVSGCGQALGSVVGRSSRGVESRIWMRDWAVEHFMGVRRGNGGAVGDLALVLKSHQSLWRSERKGRKDEKEEGQRYLWTVDGSLRWSIR
ncbi:hypothetical protein Tco_0568364 [Tanacetum coccineum]